ncbi:nucleoside-diphosphate sugar epimerase/dehydratase [Alphaproteobacteria bacterium]|nr:polysaccharide biosynthesis protein [Alphaproteobacteria bacterium]MDC1023110.1 nucleoside-diphosphate sugar epimerase/dehydratase [Alphaproteobacteria bacterium]
MLYKLKILLINKIIFFLNDLKRNTKIKIAILIDAIVFLFSLWLTLSILSETFVIVDKNILFISFLKLSLALPTLFFFDAYLLVFRNIGIHGLFCLFKSVALYAFICFSIALFFNIEYLSFKNIFVHSISFLLIASLIRVLFKFLYITEFNKSKVKNVMIYGAGLAGKQIAAALELNKSYEVLGFIDDNSSTHNLNMSGLKIFNPDNIQKLLGKKNISEIILAIPSLKQSARNKILKKIESWGVRVKTLPYLHEIISGKEQITNIKDLNISDLLSRGEIEPINDLLDKAAKGKIILVTGAGGSIGSELCRQLLSHQPKKIILLDFSEAALYKIDNELNTVNSKLPKKRKVIILPLIASVCNYQRVYDIVKTHKPDIIYHAAAYKHVPLVEKNLLEGIVNNIFGTINIVKIAAEQKVKNFVLISTDKAVRPTNMMGATKRVSEVFLQAFDKKLKFEKKNQTKLSIVRFGNVLDSSGSVVPLFKKQIKMGGPITLTHKKVERYFMTIPEAAQLVIQTTSMAKGGEVFVLGMGKRIKIYDIALKMVKLFGLSMSNKQNPSGDIRIKYIGLRPGEKMYEELLINDIYEETVHPRIMRGKEDFLTWTKLQKEIVFIEKGLKANDMGFVIKHLCNIVEGYQENKQISDNL